MIKMRTDLSAEQAREIFHYDKGAGVFIRKSTGKVVGTITKGRVVVTYRGILYAAHRVAWLICHGHWPEDQIDHIDGDFCNNRLSNLRLATASENRRNKGLQSNNKSGYKGVFWDNTNNAWKAQIKVHGKNRRLGSFKTKEDAHIAYCAALPLYHGEFARIA